MALSKGGSIGNSAMLPKLNIILMNSIVVKSVFFVLDLL